MPRLPLRHIAGFCSAASLVALLFLYGRPAAAALRIPLPSLDFSGGTFSGTQANLKPYDDHPTLLIPSLNLEVPIVKDVSPIDHILYSTALRDGVALAQGSADLTATKGNSFIFGHSSNLKISSTKYDTVFASVPTLREDDIIRVSVAGTVSTYRVVLSKPVDVQDVQYMAPTENRTVTLLTCWPIGTDLRRWVVQAVKAS